MLWRTYNRPWTLWRDLDRLRGEMDRVLHGRHDGGTRTFPALNLWRGEDRLVLTAELPGLTSDDLEISVKGETLTLRGERKADADEKRVYHRRERGAGQFTRTLDLPFRVDAEKVEAEMKNGVLRLTLPQAESDKPRKIAVKAG